MTARVVTFPVEYGSKITRRLPQSATVVVLPVTRIERYVDQYDHDPVRKLDRRKRRRVVR